VCNEVLKSDGLILECFNSLNSDLGSKKNLFWIWFYLGFCLLFSKLLLYYAVFVGLKAGEISSLML